MKKLIMFLMLIVTMFTLTACRSTVSSDYLRIHIRANSNSTEDQNIKYYAKDLIVAYLSDKFDNCKTKEDAINIIENNKTTLCKIIDVLLYEKGFNYSCNIEINNEYFPTRTYENLTLKADFYDAIIVKLGSGKGDNWWCVVYPNMCFNDPDNVVYKSKIVEIINKIKV